MTGAPGSPPRPRWQQVPQAAAHSWQRRRQPNRSLDLPLPLAPSLPPCSNLFEWAVTVLGPPDTLYEGGFFNAVLKFPRDYPQHPPDMRFTSEMWCVCKPAGQLVASDKAGLGWGTLGFGRMSTSWQQLLSNQAAPLCQHPPPASSCNFMWPPLPAHPPAAACPACHCLTCHRLPDLQAPQRLPRRQGLHLHPAPAWSGRLQPTGERVGAVEPRAHGAARAGQPAAGGGAGVCCCCTCATVYSLPATTLLDCTLS
jgi:hypothetical protein